MGGAMLGGPAPTLAPPVEMPPDMDEGPAAKRMRGEDSLMPEAEFMARNPPQVSIYLTQNFSG